jgi:hypothetical protein
MNEKVYRVTKVEEGKFSVEQEKINRSLICITCAKVNACKQFQAIVNLASEIKSELWLMRCPNFAEHP